MTQPQHPFAVAANHALAFRNGAHGRPPRPMSDPASLERRFGGPTPERGEDAASVIAALAEAAEPGLTNPAGGRFFGWVIGGSHEAGVAADWLTSAWGQNACLYATAPSAAIAEKVAAGWLLDILRLPAECSVGFVTGATMANFTALAAARNAVLGRADWDVEDRGLQGAPPVRIMIGADAHASVTTALRYLGFGSGCARRIATDDQGRMIVADLEAALADGAGPAIVIAQAGQINTGAFDRFAAIAQTSRRHGAWLHVDAAFGLWARTVPELDVLTEGLDLADSWATDGHKWLQTPYDSGIVIVRDSVAHRRAMAIDASYLPCGVYEPCNYVPELSRRARGFATWAMLRTLGRTGVSEMVRRHCRFASELAARLAAQPGVRVENDVVLNQIIVSFGDDKTTRAVISGLQADGVCFAEGAAWRGRWVMRLSIIDAGQTQRDIHRLASAILTAFGATRPITHIRAVADFFA